VNRALAAAPDSLVALRNAHAALARAGIGAPAPGPARLEEERCTTC
jgi:hypothetical protein